MVDMRKETHGPGSMKDVNLVVIAYDNRATEKDGVVNSRYLDVRLHPSDKRAKDQVSLALVSKVDKNSRTGYNNSARYSASQFDSVVEKAGDNVVDLKNANGDVLGKIYGVKADLLIANGELIFNSKTLDSTELSVADNAEGKDIRSQIFESMSSAKAAKEAVKTEKAGGAKEAPAAEAAAEAAPAAEKPKAKAPARKPRTVKPELATAEAGATVASDEPELG